MLTKNVYIIFTPGLSGTYFSWAISKADNDLCKVTVDNPINKTTSKQYGSSGTAHLHVRLPTHQNLEKHMIWVARNKPTDKRIYILNQPRAEDAIATISSYDDDGVFIVIHAENDRIIESFTVINLVTKWPIYFEILPITANQPTAVDSLSDEFDPYNCKDSVELRNVIAQNVSSHFMMPTRRIPRSRLQEKLDASIAWVKTRAKYQPHEVFEPDYIFEHKNMDNRIFEYSVMDILTDKFPMILDNFMSQSAVSDGYNIDFLESVHREYLEQQINLKWFESYKNWEDTGTLDEYLTSHMVIEGVFLKSLFDKLGLYNSNEDYVKNRMSTNWDHSIEDLQNLKMLDLFESGRWKSMSTVEINDIYQKSIKN